MRVHCDDPVYIQWCTVFGPWSGHLEEWFRIGCPSLCLARVKELFRGDAWYSTCLDLEETLASRRRAADGLHVFVAHQVV